MALTRKELPNKLLKTQENMYLSILICRNQGLSSGKTEEPIFMMALYIKLMKVYSVTIDSRFIFMICQVITSAVVRCHLNMGISDTQCH